MPLIDRRERMFLDQERRLTELRARLAAATADTKQPGKDGRRAVELEREIAVREKVLDELRVID